MDIALWTVAVVAGLFVASRFGVAWVFRPSHMGLEKRSR